MDKTILNEDLKYILSQSPDALDMIVAGMGVLLGDPAGKIDSFKKQVWIQRMGKVLFDTNTITKDLIQQNQEQVEEYILALFELMQDQQAIPVRLVPSLLIQLHCVYTNLHRCRTEINILANKIRMGYDSLFQSQLKETTTLSRSSIVAICKVLSQIDESVLVDTDQLSEIKDSLVEASILKDEESPLNEYLLDIANMPKDDVGEIYLTVNSIPDNIIAKLITKIIENYHFLPDMVKKMKNKTSIVENLILEEELETSITLGIGEIYDNLLESRRNNAETLVAWNDAIDLAIEMIAREKYDEAYPLISGMAKDNNALAAYYLAEYYSHGYGNISKDEEEAFKWYLQAAEHEVSDAQYAVGKCYENSLGVEKDQEKAKEWYTKAAEQNQAEAQFALAMHYLGRSSSTSSIKKTTPSIVIAPRTRRGTQPPPARKNYVNDTKANTEKGISYLNKSAEQGYAPAQYMLGVCYAEGRGVEKAPEKAKEWYEKAAANGHEEAKQAIENEKRAIEEEKTVHQTDINATTHIKTPATKKNYQVISRAKSTNSNQMNKNPLGITDDMVAELKQMKVSKDWALKYTNAILQEYQSASPDLSVATNQLWKLKKKYYTQALGEYVSLLRERGFGYEISAEDLYEDLPNSCRLLDDVIINMLDKYDEFMGQKTNAERYRSARKDSRFRVVGGGFGIGGAAKGIATAGAINLATGMAHSIFNGIDGFFTNSSIDSSMKKSVKSYTSQIKNAAEQDIYNMIDVYFDLIHHRKIYTEDKLKAAQNIKKAIDNHEVGSHELKKQVLQTIFYAPYVEDLYPWAFKLIEDENGELQKTAAIFGFSSISDNLKDEQKRTATTHEFFGADYATICQKHSNSPYFHAVRDDLSGNIIDIAARLYIAGDEPFDPNYLSFDAIEKSSKCVELMNRYNVSPNETPLFVYYPRAGSDGFLVTNRSFHFSNGEFYLDNITDVSIKEAFLVIELYINKTKIPITYTGKTLKNFGKMFAVFVDIYKYLSSEQRTPANVSTNKSDNGKTSAVSLAFIQKTNQELIKQSGKLAQLSSIYFMGRRDDAVKINKGISKFVGKLKLGEEAVFLHTASNDLDHGVLMTTRGIYYKPIGINKEISFIPFEKDNTIVPVAGKSSFSLSDFELSKYQINGKYEFESLYHDDEHRVFTTYLTKIIYAVVHGGLEEAVIPSRSSQQITSQSTGIAFPTNQSENVPEKNITVHNQLVNGAFAEAEGKYEEALNYYMEAVNAGSTKAMMAIADMCLAGRGVQQDSAKGIEWLKQAAQHGNTEAQERLVNYQSAGSNQHSAGSNQQLQHYVTNLRQQYPLSNCVYYYDSPSAQKMCNSIKSGCGRKDEEEFLFGCGTNRKGMFVTGRGIYVINGPKNFSEYPFEYIRTIEIDSGFFSGAELRIASGMGAKRSALKMDDLISSAEHKNFVAILNNVASYVKQIK